jgi:hypothetical protein
MISPHNIGSERCHTPRVEADLYRIALACSIFPLPILPIVLDFDDDIDLSIIVRPSIVAAQLSSVADSQNPSSAELPTTPVVAIRYLAVEVGVVSPPTPFVLWPARLPRNPMLGLDLAVLSEREEARMGR